MEHERDGDSNCTCCTWNNPERVDIEAGRDGNRRMNRNHPNFSVVKIGQNTGKSLGNLRRLAVT